MAELEDSGGGGSSSDYDSFGDKVHVEVTDLVSYFEEMSNISLVAGGAATSAMAEMGMMVHTGLASGDVEAGVFPEGAQAARLLSHRLSDFKLFITDATEGVRNIGSAAAVVAEMYENSDSENAANVGDIGFVFSDPGAQGPTGFRNAETWYEYQKRLAEESGQSAMAMNPTNDTYADVAPYPYGAYYTYSDGSKKQVHSSTMPGEDGHIIYVTTTTVTGADGKVISTETKRSYESARGDTVNETSTTTGDSQNGTTTTSSTREDAVDGSITVTNQTQSTVEGQTTDSPPTTTTVERNQHSDDPEAGPVEEAEDRLDSHGESYTVEQFGNVY